MVVIGWELSRIIIDKPFLHNIICMLFLGGLLSYIVGSLFILFKITKSSSQKTKEWSFEGKGWDYWKTKR